MQLLAARKSLPGPLRGFHQGAEVVREATVRTIRSWHALVLKSKTGRLEKIYGVVLPVKTQESTTAATTPATVGIPQTFRAVESTQCNISTRGVEAFLNTLRHREYTG